MLSMKLTYFRYQNYQIFGHIFGEQTLIYGVMVLLAVTSDNYYDEKGYLGYYVELKSHFQLFSKIVVVFRRKCNRLFLSEQKKLWLTNKGLIILIAYVFLPNDADVASARYRGRGTCCSSGGRRI